MAVENNIELNDRTRQAIVDRFRGFLPVVVDVETAGFNASTDALLEVAAVLVTVNNDGQWCQQETISRHIKPFEGANLDPAALEFTGIDPDHPFRQQIALDEKQALSEIFKRIRQLLSEYKCRKAILVGHNASFDLGFINAAANRCNIKRNPFHQFSTFDTVSLAGLAYGQTVLARAARAAGLEWQENEAHSARYDAEMTAELFCKIVNLWPLK